MKIKNKIPWNALSKLPDSKKLNKKKILILDASLKILNRHGVQELSITKIASETSLSKSLILYHFESKTKILEELFFFTHKILVYLISKYDHKEKGFEVRLSGIIQALQHWHLYNDEVSDLILLMYHEFNKSLKLKNLFQQNQMMLNMHFERLFLESMRYKTLEEVKIASSGVRSLIIGTMTTIATLENTQLIDDAFFHMRMNIESLLSVEIPATEWQEQFMQPHVY
jgi:AcrR family transcriptional regulator